MLNTNIRRKRFDVAHQGVTGVLGASSEGLVDLGDYPVEEKTQLITNKASGASNGLTPSVSSATDVVVHPEVVRYVPSWRDLDASPPASHAPTALEVSDWQEFWDDEVGAPYYFNSVTREARWICPDEF